MNILRGHFYDGHRQRVDYELIRGSGYYRHLRGVSADLAAFDPGELVSDRERIAFWVNVYNALVIHGVIELGIRDSLREVPWFFRAIAFRVGAYTLTPNAIEHGILRGNRRGPWTLRPPFGPGDPRRALRVREPDPRVHFALVCGSRSCPPIEAFAADELEEQLETAAKVFLNATTRVDREGGSVRLSRIFKWYRRDFPGRDADLVRSVARRLYDPETGEWLEAKAESVRLRFASYDWRLNQKRG